MKKALLQAIVLAALFFAVWYGLSRIDWLKLFKIEHISSKTEEQVGDILWDAFSQSEDEVSNTKITLPVDSILTRLCKANGINRSEIKLHVIKSDQVNAFAFPNKHMVVFTALINDCENESELAGVMAHELAHIHKNHVTQKLIKEVGLTTLISITSGNAGGAIIKRMLKTLSSTAYDRKLETEADLTAVDYLVKANINPEAFADFLERLADSEPEIVSDMTWMSTHPDSRKRALKILEVSEKKHHENSPILAPETWQEVKDQVK